VSDPQGEPAKSPADKPAAFPMAQGVLRFALEIIANMAIGRAAFMWRGWPAVAVAVTVSLLAWGVFNVRGDPSRNGQAPVRVPGVVRLLIELAVFAAGSFGLWRTAQPAWALAFAAVTLAHYGATWRRVRWILTR
jgi:hypothetical protein